MSNRGKLIKENFNKGVMKNNPWEYYCGGGSSKKPNNFGEDYYGSSCFWPPRSYVCSFCKREFRSAQALGGHMNVHRRDRARLRLNESPPREINLNLNPKSSPSPGPSSPNPNFFTPPPILRNLHDFSQTTATTFTSLPCLVSPPSFSSCATTSSNFLELKKKADHPAAHVIPSFSANGQSDLIRMKAVKSLFADNEIGVMIQEKESMIQEKESRAWIKASTYVGLELAIGLHNEYKEDHVDLELRLGY